MSAAQVIFASALIGAVPFSIVAFAAWLLRRRDAGSRHSLWFAVITAQLVLVAIESSPESWRFTVRVAALPAQTGPAPNIALRPVSTTSNRHRGTSFESTDVIRHRRSFVPQLWQSLEWMWLIGVGLGIARTCAGTIQLRRCAIHAQRVTDGRLLSLVQTLAQSLRIARPLTLLVGSLASIPITWGFMYPTVLLPKESLEWTEERRRLILMHEMFHIRRFDALTQLIAQLAKIVFWFSPFVWIAAAQMRFERERACDEAVLDSGVTPSHYAEELLNMARLVNGRHQPAFGALAAVSAMDLDGRVRAILGRTGSLSKLRAVQTAALAISIVCASCALSLAKPAGRESKTFSGGDSKASCLVSESGLVDVRLSVPDPGSVATVGAKSGDRTIVAAFDGSECPAVLMSGDVALTTDLDDVVSISSGGSMTVFDSRNPEAKKIVISEPNGVVVHRYTVRGVNQSWADGKEWFAHQVAHVFRDNGYAAPSRVKTLMSHGGLAAVLKESDQARSDMGRRKLLTALLDMEPVEPSERQDVSRAIRRIQSHSDRDVLLDRLAGQKGR